MRIDPKRNIDGIYETAIKKNSSTSGKSISGDTELEKDRVELSQEAISFDQISSAKAEVVNQIEKGTSADRLRSLKSEIENGTYYVSSEDIADAILNPKVKE